MSDTKRDDGGSAFPVPPTIIYPQTKSFASVGMTLRDYFAGEAMNGLLTIHLSIGKPVAELNFSELSEAAYAISDAMLKERLK